MYRLRNPRLDINFVVLQCLVKFRNLSQYCRLLRFIVLVRRREHMYHRSALFNRLLLITVLIRFNNTSRERWLVHVCVISRFGENRHCRKTQIWQGRLCLVVLYIIGTAGQGWLAVCPTVNPSFLSWSSTLCFFSHLILLARI